jgi:hypothetical protein
LDIRYVVTNLQGSSAEWLYDTLYCARGQAENLIKLHKGQLASDRTSCRSPLANQVRIVLHTAAYWLMLGVRDAIPRSHALATAEFTTLRMRLLKIAGRISETATRVRIAFAAACPKPRFSVASRSASNPPDRDTWGDRPALTRSRQPQRRLQSRPDVAMQQAPRNSVPAVQAAAQRHRPE